MFLRPESKHISFHKLVKNFWNHTFSYNIERSGTGSPAVFTEFLSVLYKAEDLNFTMEQWKWTKNTDAIPQLNMYLWIPPNISV